MPASRFDDVSDAVLAAIEEGNSQRKAAQLAGVPERTYWNWVERGKAAKTGKFRKFIDDIALAKAKGQRKLIENIRSAGEKDWRAAAWLLERLARDDWAPPKVEQQVEVNTGGDDRAANLDALRQRLMEQDEDDMELDDE